MANLVQELRILIGIKSDTGQGKQVADTVDKIGGASKKAGAGLADSAKASKELSQELGKTVAVGSATKEFLGAVRDVGKGGADSLFAMGRAAISFGNIVRTTLITSGPIGWAIAALGALFAAVIVLKDAFNPAGESVAAFKERLAELDKANLRALDATLSALSDRLKATKEEADAVRASLDKIDDAEMAAQLAAVKKSDLTAAQKDEQELLIRDEFKKRREGRQREALEQAAGGARETRDAVAPEFEDARQKYGDLLNEADRIRTLERERDRLKREISGFGEDGRSNFDFEKANRIQQIERNLLPGKSDREKFDAEFASARNRFQGEDGKGGIAAQYQAAVKESEKAERALARFNDVLQKVGEWDRARVRIENNGTDPRDTEAAARQSPGRNRLIGPDGRVVEYDSSTAPTVNQQIAATTNAMRLGGGALPSASAGTGNQLTFGKLQPGSDNKEFQQSADKINDGMTKAAEQEVPDLKPAADAADELVKKGEELATSLQQTGDSMVQAFGQVAEQQGGIVAVQSNQQGQIARLLAKVQQHDAAIATLRQRSQVA